MTTTHHNELPPLVRDLLKRHRDQLALIPDRGETQGCAYLRISEDREGDELGIDRHFEDLLSLFKARGWALDRRHVFVDNDLSAAGRRDRPDFVRMLDAIGRGELKVATAWMLDRFLRDRPDQLRLYELCEQREMLLAFARGSDIDMATPAGQIVADVLAAVARGEIKIKGARQRRAYAQAAQQGRRVGGRRPFGYEQDGVTIREVEADAVRQAYKDVAAGVPLAEIARRWNAAGLRSGQAESRTWGRKPRTAPTSWSHDTVRLVIMNPRNKGRRTYLKEEVADAVWPGLVSEEVWQAAADVLRNPSRLTGGRGDQQLLTAVALCAKCGLTVHGGGASHGQPVYRCRSLRHVSRLAGPCDRFVSDVVVGRLSRPDAAELLVDERRPDLDALREELTAKRARLDAVALDFADGLLTRSQLTAATERLRSRITAIESQMADAARVDVLGPLVGADDVQAVWGALGRARQRIVIDTLMTVRLHPVGRGTRTFRPETITVEWKRERDR